ncbi:hypothetical protein [Brevundimonas guildfordensis]|uniref:Uncharacterized protein n=1 Tax=Brevundimonas guildfordensis TaxID=2762241 RepID=A0ABR8R1U8_9CAUL|nr:hypothetical protein [Brevundimonas guildfordensis]MBD7941755.1 hypothetical protein [Brevundimonas guildfordensis]
MSRCRERALAQNPGADWADSYCAETWPAVTRSNPLVDAILAPFAQGAPAALDPADVRARTAAVRWLPARPGAQAFEGAIGSVRAVARRAPTAVLELSWTAVGEPVPYEVVEALRTRGARVSPIGCYAFGAGESNTVYRVEAAGHVPFAMTVYRREAPTANAWSTLTITADAERNIPTLDSLRAAERDSEWTTDCG